eukprot:TRINITY_DN9773_c0_g1_i1.p1 TRINITY_DN9773_c0_g1~~TRINITY_DN9773_c0_g1_i1.p1  ORF type:complete len:507 (+),score=106.76 TRINITY_DN9773_c0_g1_i1:44-1564(+)
MSHTKASTLDNYVVVGDIGRGSFGLVSRIRRKSDSKELVWKELDYGKMNEKEKQLLVSEVNILRELRHPNIVRYYDRIIDRERTKIYIVMEWCEGGDLSRVIKRCRRNSTYIDEDQIWKIFSQILLALHDCHHHKGGAILHRDIKPGNIFLDAQQNVKLGDFGLARILSKESLYARTYVGTPFYMSPEQIKESDYNEKSDIWSLGCLIYELGALVPPFEARNQLELAEKIISGRFNDLPAPYSEELGRVIKSMIQVEQARRPTTDELLQHPQISARVRERRVREQYLTVKKREEECKKKEEALEAKEAALIEREKSLADREKALLEKESSLLLKEQDLLLREKKLLDREAELEQLSQYRDSLLMDRFASANPVLYRRRSFSASPADSHGQPYAEEINTSTHYSVYGSHASNPSNGDSPSASAALTNTASLLSMASNNADHLERGASSEELDVYTTSSTYRPLDAQAPVIRTSSTRQPVSMKRAGSNEYIGYLGRDVPNPFLGGDFA